MKSSDERFIQHIMAVVAVLEERVQLAEADKRMGFKEHFVDEMKEMLEDFVEANCVVKCEACGKHHLDGGIAMAPEKCDACEAQDAKDDESGCQRVDIRQLEAQRYNSRKVL